MGNIKKGLSQEESELRPEDEDKCRAKEQKPQHRNEAGVRDGAPPARLQGRAGAWDRGAPARTVPDHGRPRLGAGLLLKAKGGDCRA